MTERVKYPRTLHLPFSLGFTSDDKVLSSVKHFEGKNVVVAEKIDGENTTLYSDYYHARSLDSKNHPSRNMVKRLHGEIKHNIPSNLRICGENVYAKHSIFYDRLTAYFYVFSIWDGERCLSWDETLEWSELLELKTVPVIYEGIWDEDLIRALYPRPSAFGDVSEGYVVRIRESFKYADFSDGLAKFVRAAHVTTSEHWMTEEIVPNLLAK